MALDLAQLAAQSGPNFGQLMAIYADNYRRLGLLFDELLLEQDRLISTVPEQLPLYVEITERHRYTTEARLSYAIETHDGIVSLDPDAHIRIYHDAEVAEATHCYPGSVSQPLFGALVPVSDVVEHRWRMNIFLDKWLEYLLKEGHSVATMRAAPALGWPFGPADTSQQAARAAADLAGYEGPLADGSARWQQRTSSRGDDE